MINGVVLIVSTLLCLLVLEAAFRLLGYGTVGKRDDNIVRHIVTGEFEHSAVLNSLGLRDEEIPVKYPDEFRILFIGDSFTYGLGVHDSETFVRQTAYLLGGKSQCGSRTRTIRVINGGVGEGPVKQRSWLQDVGFTLQPD